MVYTTGRLFPDTVDIASPATTHVHAGMKVALCELCTMEFAHTSGRYTIIA